MQIKTKGRPEKVDIGLCKEATKFFSQFLMPSSLTDKLTITLDFTNKNLDKKEYGFCDFVNNGKTPRNFTVNVKNTFSKRYILIILAHEMVHVKQYATGQLKEFVRANRGKWKGDTFNYDEIDYWFTPWEIEAYGMENGLYVRYKNFKKQQAKGFI